MSKRRKVIITIGSIIGIIVFISIGLRRLLSAEKEPCMKDFLPNQAPKEMYLFRGDVEIPISDAKDVELIMNNLYPIIAYEVGEKEVEEILNNVYFIIDYETEARSIERAFDHIKLVYPQQTITIDVELSTGLFYIEGQAYKAKEHIYSFCRLCENVAEENGQEYIKTLDDLTAIKDLLPEEDFTEVIFYLEGEGRSIMDSEIIAQANGMVQGFKGKEIHFEEERYGGYSLELVYLEEVHGISLQGNRIGIGGNRYWIAEDIAPFIKMLREAAIVVRDREEVLKK